MRNPRAWSAVAAALAAALLLAGIVGATLMGASSLRAASFDPDPEGRAHATAAEESGVSEFPEVDWDYWRGVNPDVIGWITVPGTGVDYPIVQASEDNPRRYLTCGIDGRWDYHGIPYLTWECAEEGLLESGNALVFGHHLQDGTMFSELSRFSDAEFAVGHSPILVQTPEAKARLHVLAVDRVNADAEGTHVEFAGPDDHASWLADAVGRADLVLAPEGYDCSEAAHVVTLCTCSYSTWANERTLVICVVEEVM